MDAAVPRLPKDGLMGDIASLKRADHRERLYLAWRTTLLQANHILCRSAAHGEYRIPQTWAL